MTVINSELISPKPRIRPAAPVLESPEMRMHKADQTHAAESHPATIKKAFQSMNNIKAGTGRANKKIKKASVKTLRRADQGKHRTHGQAGRLIVRS